MSDGSTLKDVLILHEGLRLKPYKDSVGKLTIGVGRNLDDVGISYDEAMFLLDSDIKKATIQAEMHPWFSALSPERKDVIINMIFNLGPSRFREFKKTIEYLAVGNFDMASREMLNSAWAKQVGNRAIHLSKIMRGNLNGG